MPVVLRVRGYKFWFYTADVVEPPHVHVGKDGNEAKFWLKPIKVAREGRFLPTDLNDIERIMALPRLMGKFVGATRPFDESILLYKTFEQNYAQISVDGSPLPGITLKTVEPELFKTISNFS